MEKLTKFEIVSEIVTRGVMENYGKFSIKDIDFDLVEELVNLYHAGIISKVKLDELVEDYYKLEENVAKN